jgi:hypothetical protein
MATGEVSRTSAGGPGGPGAGDGLGAGDVLGGGGTGCTGARLTGLRRFLQTRRLTLRLRRLASTAYSEPASERRALRRRGG